MRLYWCNDRERPQQGSTVLQQDGWTDDGRRRMVAVTVPDSVAVCRHDITHLDIRCRGCRYAREG